MSDVTPTEKPKRTRRKKAEVEAAKKVIPIIPGLTLPETPAEEAAPAAPVKKKKYINNADLMIQLRLSRQNDRMTDELAKMLMMLCERYSKHPDYANIYSYKEDMQAFANLTVVKVWKSFNPDRGNNPFAYFTQVIRHAFYQYLNHEKKQREVKDELLIDIGELPSFTYMENYRDEMLSEEYDWVNEDEEAEEAHRQHRPGYEATLPGLVTEINYAFGQQDEPPSQASEETGEL
jgi:DNA-directed RNA polymerase specialized sigma24 family protein